jgi:hypothetical protein
MYFLRTLRMGAAWVLQNSTLSKAHDIWMKSARKLDREECTNFGRRAVAALYCAVDVGAVAAPDGAPFGRGGRIAKCNRQGVTSRP